MRPYEESAFGRGGFCPAPTTTYRRRESSITLCERTSTVFAEVHRFVAVEINGRARGGRALVCGVISIRNELIEATLVVFFARMLYVINRKHRSGASDWFPAAVARPLRTCSRFLVGRTDGRRDHAPATRVGWRHPSLCHTTPKVG